MAHKGPAGTYEIEFSSIFQYSIKIYIIVFLNFFFFQECPICLDELSEQPEALKLLKCKHCFHKTCLTTLYNSGPKVSYYAIAYGALSGVADLLSDLGWVMHICVSKLPIIGSDNGLSPGRRQAIIWTSVGILLTRLLGTKFSEILIEIDICSFKKARRKCCLRNVSHLVLASMC